MLTVQDDKLDVRHDDDALSEVAEGGSLQSDPARRLRVIYIPGTCGNHNIP